MLRSSDRHKAMRLVTKKGGDITFSPMGGSSLFSQPTPTSGVALSDFCDQALTAIRAGRQSTRHGPNSWTKSAEQSRKGPEQIHLGRR